MGSCQAASFHPEYFLAERFSQRTLYKAAWIAILFSPYCPELTCNGRLPPKPSSCFPVEIAAFNTSSVTFASLLGFIVVIEGSYPWNITNN